MQPRAFDDLNERMLVRMFHLNPDCATIFGKHEPYDSALPHGGYQKLKDTLELLKEWTAMAEDMGSREEMSRDQRVSVELLRMTLAEYRFVLDDYPLWRMRPDALENPGTAMLLMLVREYAPMSTRLDSMAARIGEMPRYLSQFRERFSGVRTVKMWTEAALSSCIEFPSFFETVKKLAHTEARVSANMTKKVEEAKQDLQVHEEWLRKMLDSSTEDFAMGRANYEKLLRIRGVTMTPDELLDLANRSIDDLTAQREEVAKRISLDGDVDAARRIVESESPLRIDDVVMRTREVVEKARAFVIENNLMTVNSTSKVHVMQTPSFLEMSTSTASSNLPAVFENSQDTVFLITDAKDPVQFRSTWNYYAIDDTAVHEAYPGHHHQGVMSNRRPWMHQLPHIIYSPDTLSPPYESQEGWATYCESLMQERGFLWSDKHALGLLDYYIWTACRTISDVKLACRMATVDEMIDMTARASGSPRASAEADVKGFARTPGYGFCYLLGKHLVMKLKTSLKDELGKKFSEKVFHDLVAENGNLPFHLLEEEVRWGMANH